MSDWLTVLREGVSVPLEEIPLLLVSHTSHGHTGVAAETVSHGLAWPRLALLMMHCDWLFL